MTVILIFQTVAKLINFDAKYKTIFQEAGLLHMLINLLKQFYLKNFNAHNNSDAPETEGYSPLTPRSPKLHFTLQHKLVEEGSDESLPGDEGSNYTVVMDCIALLLEGQSSYCHFSVRNLKCVLSGIPENVRIFKDSNVIAESKGSSINAIEMLQHFVYSKETRPGILQVLRTTS